MIFPSITVCNLNKIEASFLRDLDIYGDGKATKIVLDEFIDGRNTNLTEKQKVQVQKVKILNIWKGAIDLAMTDFMKYSVCPSIFS